MGRGAALYSPNKGGTVTGSVTWTVTEEQAKAYGDAGFISGAAVGRRIVLDGSDKLEKALIAALGRSVRAVSVNPKHIALNTSADGIAAEIAALQGKLDMVHTAQANLSDPVE